MVLLGAPSGLHQAFSGKRKTFLQDELLSMPPGVRELVNTVGFFGILWQLYFDSALVYLVYSVSGEVARVKEEPL